MLGTKTRALMQREQGRDLFDLSYAWQFAKEARLPIVSMAQKPCMRLPGTCKRKELA